jgi:hypothetical protein
MIRSFACALLLAALVAAPARAQTPAVQPGQKVRVTVPVAISAQPLTGTVVEANAQYLTLTREGARAAATIELPWDQVRQLEVSRGHLEGGTGVGKSVTRGVIVGALAGAASGVGYRMMRNSVDEEGVTDSAGESALKGVAVGVPLGAIVGVFVASGAREDWERVRLPRVALDTGAGTRVSLAFRF